MSSSIGIGAVLSLNTGGFTRELENAKKAYQRFVRETERDTKESFRTTIRNMGSTGRDVGAARAFETRSMYQRDAIDNDWMNSIRTMSRQEASVAMSARHQESFLNATVKAAAAMKGMEFVIDSSVVGAKIMTGELRDMKKILEEASKLPLVGGLFGASGGALSYARADDVKDFFKQAEAERARQQQNIDAANMRAQKALATTAAESDFSAVVAQLSDYDRTMAEIEKSRQDKIRAVEETITAMRSFGKLNKDVISAADRAVFSVNREAMSLRLAAYNKRSAEEAKARHGAAEEAERAARQQEEDAARQRREALSIKRDEIMGRLGAEQEKASAISSQRLGLMTAFANPGVYMTGSQQREVGIKPGLDAIRKELEEVNRQLREDKSVRVGNN